MPDKFKFNRVTAIAITTAVTVIGGSIMSFASLASQKAAQPVAPEQPAAVEAENLSLPNAGMGDVIEEYVGTMSGSSVELLSTTALASSLGDSYNEYYDENGEIIGKYIVYKGKKKTKVYDVIPGTEEGDKEAKVVGYLRKGDVATLVTIQDDWYQIISDSLNGFVKKKDFAKGIDAEKMDKKTYVKAAYVVEDDAWLFEDPWDYSAVLCVLPKKVRYELVEEGDEFSKIKVEGIGEGWVRNVNLDIKKKKERRYGITAKDLKSLEKKIDKGIEAATEIEDVKVEEAETYEKVSKKIKPAPADSDDVAALREAIAAYAQEFVGILPYMWGNSDLEVGADCSGFTSAIYREYGIEISRSSDAQTWGGTSVSEDDVRPGDIVCYPGHVALYIGDGMVVHESNPGTTASYADMHMMPIINIARYIN